MDKIEFVDEVRLNIWLNMARGCKYEHMFKNNAKCFCSFYGGKQTNTRPCQYSICPLLVAKG